MFDGDQHDRTIAPTPRRLAEARRAGAFARSRDFTSAVSSVAAVAALILLGPRLWSAAEELLQTSWKAPITRVADGPLAESAADALMRVAGLLAVVLGAPLLAALVANAMQAGFRFDLRRPQMQLSAVSPFVGLRRMRNGCGWAAIAQLMLKLVATTCVVYRGVDSIRLTETTAELGSRITTVGLQIAAVLVAISVLDWALRRRQFLRKLRLTPSEARQEARESLSARRPRTRPAVHVSATPRASIGHAGNERLLPTDPLFS